jgi:hypothetical protein
LGVWMFGCAGVWVCGCVFGRAALNPGSSNEQRATGDGRQATGDSQRASMEATKALAKANQVVGQVHISYVPTSGRKRVGRSGIAN